MLTLAHQMVARRAWDVLKQVKEIPCDVTDLFWY